jgi:hypothetical protein
MSDRSSHNLEGLKVDLARRIDEVCRRFEADWRQGRQLRIEDYPSDVPDEGCRAFRAGLEALVRELQSSEETAARPDVGPPTAPESWTPANPSTIAEAPTIAPGSQPTIPVLGAEVSLVHHEATVSPRDQATIELGSSRPAQPVHLLRTAFATSEITSCCSRSRAAAWDWFIGRGRSV